MKTEMYKKVFIKSEADLPKEDGYYTVRDRDRGINQRWNDSGTHLWWMEKVEYYLQPIESLPVPVTKDEKIKGIIKYLSLIINNMETTGESMEYFSWGEETGVILSGNDAKHILTYLSKLSPVQGSDPVCKICGDTGRGTPTLGEPDGAGNKCICQGSEKKLTDEYILCAAIDFKGMIITGYRHSDCYNMLKCIQLDISDSEMPGRDKQGFLTSKKRFVSRREAWHIAMKNNQIAYGPKPEADEEPFLISENLY